MEKDLLKNDYEKRYKALFYNSPNGMAIVNCDGGLLELNNELCDILGYTKEELLTKSFQDITHPDDVDIDIDLCKKVLNKEIRDYSLLKRYIRKDQSEIHSLLIVNGIFDANDNFKYFISQIINLQSIVMNDKKLKSINKDMNSFIKIASHDVREPLRNINISLNNLLNYCKSRVFNINSYVIEIEKNVKTISDILDDFSVYASIDTNLSSYIECRDFSDFISNQFPNKNIEISQSCDICVKQQDLYYLFEQLISNSEKFCHQRVSKIFINCVDNGPEYVISYRDNGIGIPEEFHSKVFLPFFQLDPKRYEGNGIGLAICKKICEKYNGSITITRSSHEGTEFKIVIKKIEK